MRRLYIITAICVFSAFSGTLKAQVVNSIIRDTDPAAAALGGASVANDANAFAIDNNAASMSLSSLRMAAGASYSLLQPSAVKMGVISASGYYRVADKLAIGAGFKSLSYDSYPVTSSEGRSTEEFAPKEIALKLGASYLITEGLSAGVNVKFASVSFAPTSVSKVICADVSAMYRAGALTAGINAANLGSQVMDIRAGAAYKLSVIKASAQAEFLSGAGLMGAVGAEYSFKDFAFVRTGVHLGSSSKAIPTFWSVGAGVKYLGIGADVSYSISSATVGNSVSAGISYSF